MSREIPVEVYGVAVSCDRSVLAEWLEQFVRESARSGVDAEGPARLCREWLPRMVHAGEASWGFRFPASILDCGYSEARLSTVCETVEQTWRRLFEGGGGDLLLEANLLRVDPEQVADLARALRESVALGAPSSRFERD